MEPTTELRFEAIGTNWYIGIGTVVTDDEYDNIIKNIRLRIAAYDQAFSRFKSDSIVSKLALRPGSVKLPPEAVPLLALYKRLYDMTSGAFTPLIGDVLDRAGYDADYSLRQKSAPEPALAWDDVLHFDGDTLTTKKATILDFGAAGKGQLVDIVFELLLSRGIDKFVVDAGGDMRHHSANHEILEVALEHPRDPKLAIGVANIYNQSICCSSDSRRRWGDNHHLMDPSTSESTTGIIASWTTATSCMLADAVATALFLCPADVLQQHFDFEYCIVDDSLTSKLSPGFPAHLFTATDPG